MARPVDYVRDHAFSMFCLCGPCRRDNYRRVFARTAIIMARRAAQDALEEAREWEVARGRVTLDESRIQALAAFGVAETGETMRPEARTIPVAGQTTTQPVRLSHQVAV